jgi:hypothetical protein
MADAVDQLETEAAAVAKCGRGSRCSDSTEQKQHGVDKVAIWKHCYAEY